QNPKFPKSPKSPTQNPPIRFPPLIFVHILAFPVTPKPSLSNPTPFSTFLVHEESPFTLKSVPLFHEYKQARKALRAVLPISICTKLVGFSVDGVLILVFLWVLKAFLEVLAFRDIAPQAPKHILIIPKSNDGLTGLCNVHFFSSRLTEQ
ncbi:hypothetical protein J1N35_028436, partial [Gossypium stocksii]